MAYSAQRALLHASAKALLSLALALPTARNAFAEEQQLPRIAPEAQEATQEQGDGGRPSPLEVDYAQYGVAMAGEVPIFAGEICPGSAVIPCIIGIGGGPVLRGGFRPSGPWYIGGAYQFAKLDSNNLYRLGILQTLRAEMRYFIDIGSRFAPYVTWAAGAVVYGNEFGVETGGAAASAGAGVEFEITRMALIGLNLSYEPLLLAGFTDSAGQERGTGVAHFVHMEITIELRAELGRE